MIKFRKFTKKERSSFSYFFWHWLAYNYTACKLGVWKPKWLLHDIEKPWLKLFLKDYKKVQKWHRMHNDHHLHYGRKNGLNKVDWLAAVLDWECSRLTKLQAQKTARQEALAIIADDVNYNQGERDAVMYNVLPILDYLEI